MGAKIMLILFVSAAVCVSMKGFFPRRGAWLSILMAAVLPPLLFVLFGVLSMLRDIGASTPDGATSPPGTAGLNSLTNFAALWVVLAATTVVILLHFHKRFAQRP